MMLTDQEIDGDLQKVTVFRKRIADEENFLQRYADLLDKYKLLKSDYEEEKAGRERYKQLARSSERNPFVLVLIDGDGYVFDDAFFQQGADGGSHAAQHLNNVIRQSLRAKGLENCGIMIRVYANLVNLSKILAKHGLTGPEKRSLSSFVANFNRSYGLTDFVDAGELKENADFKLRALFNLYADNAQCKHIYFAACHDVGYISELTRFMKDKDRITLIRSKGLLFHERFARLDLGIEELPGVFRSTPLDLQIQPAKSSSPNSFWNASSTAPDTQAASHEHSVSAEQQKLCSYFQAGKCRYGKGCKNLHTESAYNPARLLRTSSQKNSDTDFMAGYSQLKSPQSPNSTYVYDFDHTSDQDTIESRGSEAQLPDKKDIPPGHVAVNKQQQRLDPYMAPPSASTTARLRELSSTRKYCNNKQLTGICHNEDCEYEHEPLPASVLPALEWLSRSLPCANRGRCRNALVST
jgi:hypothetical protein